MSNAFPIFFTHISDKLGRYKEVGDKVEAISTNYPVEKYPKILDICCGIGHYTRALAKKGYQTTGIDLSPEQIAQAKKECKKTKYLVCDMSTPPADTFDLIINTYSSFGYGLTPGHDQQMLNSWFYVLRKGGVLIMELTDLEKAKYDFPWPATHKTRINNGVEEFLKMDWEKQLLTVYYRYQSESYSGFTRIYSGEQISNMLSIAGFNIMSLAGDFNQSLKQENQRLVITCTK